MSRLRWLRCWVRGDHQWRVEERDGDLSATESLIVDMFAGRRMVCDRCGSVAMADLVLENSTKSFRLWKRRGAR